MSGVVPPDNILQRDYDGARYFYKAGIFFSHPNFNECHNNTRSWSEHRYNWLQFLDLTTLMEHPDEKLNMKYRWNDNENLIYTQFGLLQTCLRTTVPDCDISLQPNTLCTAANDEDFDGITEFVFVQYERSKTLVFGDIRFQATLDFNDTCQYLRTDTEGMLRPEGAEAEDPIAQIHYMKTMYGIDYDVGNFNEDEDTLVLSHFRYDEEFDEGDLYNVRDVWLTGFRECDMTGSNMPNNDFVRQDLQCLN